MEKNISVQEIIHHPVFKKIVSKLSEGTKYSGSDLEKDVKLPYVIKDKILMSPGVWNSFFYSTDAIISAFKNTDWEDKEVRSLFLDHEDRNAREWVGEVNNIRLNGENLIGDLVIVDKNTAIKLAYGAKMGISPKVHGGNDDGKMIDFLYDNFSVVINPAIKTAYINNSQKEDLKSKKPYGDVSYADPGYQKDGMFRYPLDTVNHVRSAWNYINMPKNQKFYSESELGKIKSKIKQAAERQDIEIKNSETELSELPLLERGAVIERLHHDTYLSLVNFVNEQGELPPAQFLYESLARDNLKYNKNYYDREDKLKSISIDIQEVTKMSEEQTENKPDEQVQEVKTEEVKTEEVKTEEVKTEEVKTEEVKTEVKEESATEEVKADEVKTEEVKTEEPAQATNEMSDVMALLKDIQSKISANSDAIKEMQETKKEKADVKKDDKKEDEKAEKVEKEVIKDDKKEEKKMSDNEKTIQEMSEKINVLEGKLNEPEKLIKKVAELSQSTDTVDADDSFMSLLKSC